MMRLLFTISNKNSEEVSRNDMEYRRLLLWAVVDNLFLALNKEVLLGDTH